MMTRKVVRKRAANAAEPMPKINHSRNSKNNNQISNNNRHQEERIRTISSSKQVERRVDEAKRARGRKKSPSTNVMFAMRYSHQGTKSCSMSIKQVMREPCDLIS